MINPPPIENPRGLARLAGLVCLTIIVCGIFAQAVVRGGLIDYGDAAATATAIREGEQLWRYGLLADFIVFTSDIILAVLLYALLRPVGARLAMFAAIMRIMMATLMGLNLLNEVAPLLLLGDHSAFAAMDAAQRETLSLFFLAMHNKGYILGLMFFGVHLLALAVLLYRSGYFPRLIGLLIFVSGLSYLGLGLADMAFTQFDPFGGYLLIPAALGEFTFTGWLLIVGLNRKRWEERLENP